MKRTLSVVLILFLILAQITISSAEEYGNNPSPFGLKISDLKSGEVTLSWNKLTEAGYYDIYRTSIANGNLIKIGSVDQPTNNTLIFFTDTGLNPQTSYWYKVIAVNSLGENTDYEEINVTTKKLSKVFKITSPKNGSQLDLEDIQIKWDTQKDVTESTITLTDLTSNKIIQKENLLNKTNYQISKTKLIPGHKYKIALMARYENNISSGSFITINIRPFASYLYVGNGGPFTRIPIKSTPKPNSKTIGFIYGSLMNIEIIKDKKGKDVFKNNYYMVKTWNYVNTRPIPNGYIHKSQIKRITTTPLYGIIVDISDQKMYIYKKDKLIDSYLVSTGLDLNNWQTPLGTYITGPKVNRFYSPSYQEGAYYGVRFNKGYMFHSVVIDKNNRIISREAAKLGKKASHGCVRQPLAKAKWLYKNIPARTPVIIQK